MDGCRQESQGCRNCVWLFHHGNKCISMYPKTWKKKRDRENTTLRAEPGYCIIPRPAPPCAGIFVPCPACCVFVCTYVQRNCAQVGMEATISKKKKGCQRCLLSYVTAGKSSNQMCSMRIRNGKSSVRGVCVVCDYSYFFFSSQSQGGYWEIPDLDEQRQGRRSMSCEQRVVFSWVQLLLPFSLTL